MLPGRFYWVNNDRPKTEDTVIGPPKDFIRSSPHASCSTCHFRNVLASAHPDVEGEESVVDAPLHCSLALKRPGRSPVSFLRPLFYFDGALLVSFIIINLDHSVGNIRSGHLVDFSDELPSNTSDIVTMVIILRLLFGGYCYICGKGSSVRSLTEIRIPADCHRLSSLDASESGHKLRRTILLICDLPDLNCSAFSL